MASYAQIAQKTFTIDREDGTSRTWQFTFDKKNGSAQTYEVPIIEDIEIIEGDRSDAPNKPFKTHRATFKVKGVDEPLIDEIAAAGLRDIRVTIEDTATSTVKFQGYVLKELTTYRLYNEVQEVSVNCYGGLADLDGSSILFDSSQFGLNVTLDELADQIATVLDLSRELDIYTSLYHQGLTASDPFPTDVSYNEEPIVGEGDDATMLDVVKNVMTALGFQLFQRGGRLVMADLYDRFANSSAINKHESDGAGGYTNTSENVEVTLSQSNVIKGGEFKDLAPVIALQQRYSMTHREAAAFTDPSPTFESRGNESEHNMGFGLGLEGDVISVTIDGDIVTSGPGADVAGSVEFARLELQDYLSGKTFYFNPNTNAWVETSTGWSQSFSFTGGGGIQEQPFSVNTDLPPVPEGLLAKIVLVTSCDVTVTSGSATDVTQTDYDNLNVAVEFADPDASVTHVFEAASADAVGDTLQGNTFLGDEDLHTDNHAFQFNNSGVPTDTFNWISATGNGRLGSVVSERAGTVVVGTGQEFTVLIRDTTDVDLLSVIKITDNDGVTRTCFPTEVRHRLSSGYYRVRVRETFNGVTTTSDTYGLGAVSGVGSSAGSGVTIGRGTSDDSGDLSVTEADTRYFKQGFNLSEGDPATMRANMGLADQTADLDLNSISVNGTNLFPNGSPQALGTPDSPTFAGLTSTGDVSINEASARAVLNKTDGNDSGYEWHTGGSRRWVLFSELTAETGSRAGSNLRLGRFNDGGGFIDNVLEATRATGHIAITNTLSLGTSALNGSETFRNVGASRLEGDVTATADILPDVNYASNLGSLTKKFLSAHIAELQAEILTVSERRSTTGGRFNVGIATTLAADLGSADTEITTEDNNLNNGDIIHLEKVGQVEFIKIDGHAIVAVDTTNEVIEISGDETATYSAGNTIVVQDRLASDETFTIASLTFNGTSGNTEITVNEDITDGTVGGKIVRKGTDPYTYVVVTRNLDGSGANDWIAGDGIFNTGTTGNGFIDLYATNSLLTGASTSGPTIAHMVRTGTAFNDLDVRTASGNLKGWYGIATDEFGFAAGEYNAGAGNFIILTENTANLQIDTFNLDTTTLIVESTTPKIALGAAADSLGLTSVSDTGTFLNGSGHVRVGTTDVSGNLTEGFKFDGTNFTLEAANTSLDSSGNLTATNAILSGAITATSGSITGAFDIEGTLTMGTGGEITNAAGDFFISSSGISTQTTGVFSLSRAYTIETSGGTTVFELWSDGSNTFISGNSLIIESKDISTVQVQDSLDVTGKLTAGSGTEQHLIDGFLEVTLDLKAGVWNVTEIAAAPGTPSEGGRIYIDPSDGDLKIKFDNGTVRTLATN